MSNSELVGERWQAKLAASFVASGVGLCAKGNLGAAVQAYKSALAVTEMLADADPANSESQGEVASCCSDIGYALVGQGRFGEASDFCVRGLSIREKLHALEPLNVEWQRRLALARLGMGEVASGQGDFLKAREWFSAALLIREALFNAHPDNTEFGANVAYVYRVLGDGLVLQDRLEEAYGAFATAVALVETLAQGTPAEHGFWATLVDLHRRVAGVHFLARRPWDAIRSGDEALRISIAATQAKPDDLKWAEELYSTCKVLGDVASFEDDALQLETYLKALAVAQRMVAADPGYLPGYVCISQALSRLGGVLHSQRGNWQLALDDLAVAREAMGYLVKIDPLNLCWHADFAELVRMSGEVEALGRQSAAARTSYALALSMYEAMIAIDPAGGRWAKKAADVQNDLADFEEAKDVA
ncbi:tetratricopeptide repeat protein [Hyphomicrobium sp.]|uniref:tetratricopeptide repeat protein n=1 Tax=Hyphomicrobium sp. TaxID=82 RepID=UPI0035689400